LALISALWWLPESSAVVGETALVGFSMRVVCHVLVCTGPVRRSHAWAVPGDVSVVSQCSGVDFVGMLDRVFW